MIVGVHLITSSPCPHEIYRKVFVQKTLTEAGCLGNASTKLVCFLKQALQQLMIKLEITRDVWRRSDDTNTWEASYTNVDTFAPIP